MELNILIVEIKYNIFLKLIKQHSNDITYIRYEPIKQYIIK